MSRGFEARLAELGITLPAVFPPAGNYLGCKRAGERVGEQRDRLGLSPRERRLGHDEHDRVAVEHGGDGFGGRLAGRGGGKGPVGAEQIIRERLRALRFDLDWLGREGAYRDCRQGHDKKVQCCAHRPQPQAVRLAAKLMRSDASEPCGIAGRGLSQFHR